MPVSIKAVTERPCRETVADTAGDTEEEVDNSTRGQETIGREAEVEAGACRTAPAESSFPDGGPGTGSQCGAVGSFGQSGWSNHTGNSQAVWGVEGNLGQWPVVELAKDLATVGFAPMTSSADCSAALKFSAVARKHPRSDHCQDERRWRRRWRPLLAEVY